MTPHRVPVLVGVAVAGAALLTATALRAMSPDRPVTGRIEMAAGLTSSMTENGVEVTAAAGAVRVAGGAAVSLTVSVRSESGRVAVVGLEVYDPAGQRVLTRSWAGQRLLPGTPGAWTVQWTAPPDPGRYRVAVGVFSAGWETLLAWNNQAAYVMVAGRRAASEPPVPGAPSPPATLSAA